MFNDSDKTVSTAISATAKVGRLYRLGAQRVSRAHLSLQRRPQVASLFGEALSNACTALQGQLGCEVKATAQITGQVVPFHRATSAESASVLVELDALSSAALVEIDRPVLHAALDRLSGGPGRPVPTSRLTRIEEAAFGFLSLLCIQSLRAEPFVESRLGPRLRTVNLSRFDLEAISELKSDLLSVRIALSVGAVEGQVRIFVPAKALQMAMQSEPTEVPSEIAEELLAAGLPSRVFAGRLVLDAAELNSLRPGDVLVFDGVTLANGALHGAARLGSSSFELFGVFSDDGFTFQRALARTFPQENSMSQPSHTDDASNLPVDVEIELTRVRLSLTDLATLRPGSILPLHINATEPVILRVGDRAVARAELVEIEGEVGARILSFLS